MTTRLFALAALALSLAACTQNELADDNRLPEGEYPVVIRATGLSVEATPQAAPSTRATVDGDWQGVQTVALKMGDAVKEYTVTATDADGYKSAMLSSENNPHYWTSRDPITVSAWWPFDDTDITQMPAVKVAGDQSTQDAFAASDFIAAIDQTVEYDNPTIEFTHRTARVSIALKPGTGFTSVDGAKVSLVSLSADNENPTAIKTYHASGSSYEALTAPQTVAAGEPFIQVELGSGIYSYRPQNDVVLEAGSRYTYTVKVNATGLTLEGCTIGDWADGGGESGEAEELGYTYNSSTNTYTVTHVNGLKYVADVVNYGETDINITLANDIDLTGIEWAPIGNYEKQYIGTFDGGGHTITGLTVDQPETNNVGLIGYLGENGMVQNVKLDKVNIKAQYNVGGILGYNNGGSIIGCSVSGDISGAQHVGGVVGYFTAGNNVVTACYHKGSVSGSEMVGGVAGNSAYGSLTACYHAGNVSGSQYVGGVTGAATGSLAKVIACYWSGYDGNGIGIGYGEATKVNDGDFWQTAVDAMNAALQSAGSEWRYELTGELPTLKKEE